MRGDVEMKKKLLVGAIAGLVSAGAFAQSSVTLYGIIDTGVTYVNNTAGKSQVSMASGINQGSRWGLLGKEDLGGGLKAVFNLESEFFVNNGEMAFSNILFNRRAYVGLSSDQFGTIVAGRDYDFLYDYVSYYTNVAQFAPAYAFHLADDIDRLAGEQVQNAVRYETPTFHGVQAGVMYGMDNGNSAATPHVLSFGLKYSPTGSFHAPYSFSAAYTKTVGGATTIAASPGTGATLAQMASGADSIYTAAVAGQVNIDKWSVNALFTYTNQDGITRPGPMVAKVTNVYEAGVQYHLTPFWTLGLGDAWIDQHKQGQYNQASYGVDYRFSKRTDVFLFGTWQRAFGAATNAGLFLATTPGLMNQPALGPEANTAAGLSTTRDQFATQIGIRHVF
jgi:predicted porin